MLESATPARPSADQPAVAVVAADRRIRDSLASLLGASGDVRVVGVAGDAAAAVRLVTGARVDVVIVDRDLANGDRPAALLPLLRHGAPDARLLVIDWSSLPRATAGQEEADAILDLADLPATLLAEVLQRPPTPDSPARSAVAAPGAPAPSAD